MPSIKEHQEAYQSAEALIKQRAANLYKTFDENERLIVRFGMFPAGKMQADLTELWRLAAEGMFPGFDRQDISRLHAVGVMDAANAGPEKMVV